MTDDNLTPNEDSQGLRGKLGQLPGLARMLVFAGGGVIALLILGNTLALVGRLLSNAPTSGEPVAIVAPANSDTSPTPSDPLQVEADRQKQWESVQGARIALSGSISNLDDQLRLARAQRWQMFANQRCQEQGAAQCPSSYTWLLRAYLGQAADLQRQIRDGRLVADSQVIDQWRQQIGTLEDLSAALSLEIQGTTPRPFVPTAEVSQAIDSFYEQSARFEALRQAAALRAYDQRQPSPPTQAGGQE